MHSAQELPLPDIKVLRDAIPAKCFERSLSRSMAYVVRDLLALSALFSVATLIPSVESLQLKILLWTVYGFVTGLVFTGIWIIAHECGHGSFSKHDKVNSAVGFVMHSIVLVPFFSWKFTHSRHHLKTNHMTHDTVFVPHRKNESRTGFLSSKFLGHAEDAPIVTLLMLLGHQLFGWPAYMLMNSGAGVNSMIKGDRKTSSRQSHLDPTAHIFTTSEHPFVLLSNLGLLATFAALYQASRYVGVSTVLLAYGLPYLWMNHWLVAITYLHHTHPDAVHYEPEAWTFVKGATATVDRDFGFIGKHFFHGIIEFHAVHHLFPRIPFYHAEEATAAIAPLLGKNYIRQDTSFIQDLWTTFRSCRYVENDATKPGHLIWGKTPAVAPLVTS